MSAETSVIKIALEEAEGNFGIKTSRRAVQMAEKMRKTLEKAFEYTGPKARDFKRLSDRITGDFAQGIARAVDTGFSPRRLRDYESKIAEIGEKLKSAHIELAKAEEERAKSHAELVKKQRDKEISEVEKEEARRAHEQLEAVHAEADARFRGLEKAARYQDKRFEEEIKQASEFRRQMGIEDQKYLAGKAAAVGGAVSEGFAAGLRDLTSKDAGAWAGLGKKIGKSMQGAGALASARGGEGTAMGGLGAIMKGLGGAVIAIGAVAVGLAALVKVVMDVDSKVKEWNKSLLQAGMSGADLAVTFKDVDDRFKNIRGSFAKAFDFNRLWGASAKDHLAILGAYSQAGLTFKEITQNVRNAAEQTQKLQQASAAALTYSKLLGMSSEEIATNFSSYMEELGLTLEGVQKRFSAISIVARESGFGVKRFFGMLLQATSGMSMYNVRLSEAAGLLTDLGKILGEKLGGDALQKLMQGFKGESTQERVKKTMTTGVKYSLRVLREEAVAGAEEFGTKLEEWGKKDVEGANKFKQVMADAGLTAAVLQDPKKTAAELAKMSLDQQNQLIARAGTFNDDLARMLRATVGQSQAFKGGIGGAQAARAYAGPGAALLLQLNELGGTLGVRLDQIADTNIEARMAAENITGRQAEEMKQLVDIGRTYAGREGVILQVQKQLKSIADPNERKKIATGFNEVHAKEWGIALDAEGKRHQGSLAGKVLENTFEDLLRATGKGPAAQVSEDILLAQKIAKNTTSIADILEMKTDQWLSDIFDLVERIANWFGGLSDEEKSIKQQALRDITDSLKASVEAASKVREALATKKGQLEEAKGSKQRKARLAALEKEQKFLLFQQNAIRNVTEGYFGTSEELGLTAFDDPKVRAQFKGMLNPEELADVEKRIETLVARTPEYVDKGTAKGDAEKTVLLDIYGKEQENIRQRDAARKIQEGKDRLDLAKKIQDEADTAQREELEGLLTNAGMEEDQAKRLAREMQGPEGIRNLEDLVGLTPETKKILSRVGGKALSLQTQAQLDVGGGGQAQDMVMQVGRHGVKFAQRVSPNDVGVFAKPGGALAGASGGGRVNYTIHNYNNPKGYVANLERAYRAGVTR